MDIERFENMELTKDLVVQKNKVKDIILGNMSKIISKEITKDFIDSTYEEIVVLNKSYVEAGFEPFIGGNEPKGSIIFEIIKAEMQKDNYGKKVL